MKQLRQLFRQPRLTEAQYKAAYEALNCGVKWEDSSPRTRLWSREKYEAIASPLQYSSEAAQEPRFTLDEIEAAIQAEGDRISWPGFGAMFANAIRVCLSPKPPVSAVDAVRNLFQMRSDQRQFMGRTPEEIVAAVRQADADGEIDQKISVDNNQE